eukprot:1209541-Pyramimonas_sp.AAC.1
MFKDRVDGPTKSTSQRIRETKATMLQNINSPERPKSPAEEDDKAIQKLIKNNPFSNIRTPSPAGDPSGYDDAPVNRGREDTPVPDDDIDEEDDWHGGKPCPRNPLVGGADQACVANSSSSDEGGETEHIAAPAKAMTISSSSEKSSGSASHRGPEKRDADYVRRKGKSQSPRGGVDVKRTSRP